MENHGEISKTPETLVKILKESGVGALPDFGNFPDEATRGSCARCSPSPGVAHAKLREGQDFARCMRIAKESDFRGVFSIEAGGREDPPSRSRSRRRSGAEPLTKAAAMSHITRRTFLGGLAAASAFTIVPRRVLGGAGYVAPSDMILLAQVGCGTQAQRQVNTGLLRREDIQFVAVVDPNKNSQNYVDWEPFGNRERIRRFLEESRWGEGDTGIRAGRDVARQINETYYKKHNRPAAGVRSYEDYREMLAKETDIRASSTSRRTTSTGASTSPRCGRGKAAISHKPLASVLAEVRRTLDASRELGPFHVLPTATHPIGTRSRRGSTRASSARSARYTTGPLAPSGRRGGRSTTSPGRPCQQASTGSCGRGPSRIGRITRTTRSACTEASTPTAPAASATWASIRYGSRTAS